MRNLIDIVTTEMLTEGKQDYIQMFKGVLDAVSDESWRNTDRKDDPAINMADQYRTKLSSIWENEIKWARENLKRQDRIIWYLRYSRLNLLVAHKSAIDEAKLNRLMSDYSKTAASAFGDAMSNASMTNMKETLVHFLSLPIPAIQDYQFRLQSLDQVHYDMIALEGKWKEKLDSTLEDNDSTIIIDFKNGWCWVNTEKAYCTKEAKAMGHCGNSPRADSGDHLLSLRKKVEMGRDKDGKEVVRWEPHLTFILSRYGMLTEMKGRGNEKPVARYHSMIIALLENDLVEGIVGGGYMPENNFSLNDLAPEVRESLIEKKPELGTLLDMYEKRGLDSAVKSRLESILSNFTGDYGSNRLEIHDYDGDEVILEHWDNMAAFIRDKDYEDKAGIENIYNVSELDFNEIEWLSDALHNDEGDALIDMLDLAESSSEDDEYTRVKKFQIELARKTGVDQDDAVNALVHIFPKSIMKVFEHVREYAQEQATRDLRSIPNKIQMDFWAAHLEIAEDNSVLLKCSANDLISGVSDHLSDDEYGDDYGFHQVAREGEWMTFYGRDMFDPDPDQEEGEGVPNFTQLYNRIQEKLIEEILSLFDTNDQLSFDFNQD